MAAQKPLLQAIKESPLQAGGSKCSVKRAFDALDESDREGLREALADGGIQSTTIARVLKDRGLRAESKAIQRHRRGECMCGEA